MDDYGFLNEQAQKRSMNDPYTRTNEFLVKIAMMPSLPVHERPAKMQEILREVFTRMLQLEERIAELEEKL